MLRGVCERERERKGGNLKPQFLLRGRERTEEEEEEEEKEEEEK